MHHARIPFARLGNPNFRIHRESEYKQIAPVLGVRGHDDVEDLRTRRSALLLGGEGYLIGCVYDAVEAGLASSSDPFVETEDAAEICNRIFGGPVNILLHASTHRFSEAPFGAKGAALKPGSAVLPAEGSAPSFLRLKVARQGCYGQIIRVA